MFEPPWYSRSVLAWRLLLVALVSCLQLFAADSVILATLERELGRNFTALQEKTEIKPYFMAYSVTDLDGFQLSATMGALQSDVHSARRYLDVTVRVGSPELDNYHRMRNLPLRFGSGAFVPIEDQAAPLAREIWLETAQTYRAAVERLIQIRTDQKVKADEVDRSPDFSAADTPKEAIAVPLLQFNPTIWKPRVEKWSAVFLEFPKVLSSGVGMSVNREEKFFVNTEGARLRHGRRFARIVLNGSARAPDGMDVDAGESFEAETSEGLPDEPTVAAACRRVAQMVTDLVAAPPADPFVGPAILSGRAAGVFFHEIFGHRVEGHRQKDEQEGQTFTSRVGQPVLPPFLSVIFDPTLHEYGGEDLHGWYAYDDEGVKSRRVDLVDGGVLKTFLLTRSPIEGFPQTNGHGRRQPGAEIVARQSNLIVESSRRVPEAQLRQMLIDEVKRQGKDYGLYFEEVTGGFTFTGREGLQTFRVMPRVVYKVFADGRPDQLIRGANIVGTPLAAFSKIIATSDKAGIFNGYCGAESGRVPVAAVSPALLVSEIEVEKKPSSNMRPPFLPSPLLEPTR